MNYIQDLINTNHLKIEEPFGVVDLCGTFKFDKGFKLFRSTFGDEWNQDDALLRALLAGEYRIHSLHEPTKILRDVVKSLGVEFEELFRIRFDETTISAKEYRFTGYGLVDSTMMVDEYVFSRLVTGIYTIVKGI